MTQLNPRQKEAIRLIDGPLLVLAGAGSGKTSVITRKIAWLIQEHGFDPARITAVTFTNKAAREMKSRVGELLKGSEARGLSISTFHTLGLNLLRGQYNTEWTYIMSIASLSRHTHGRSPSRVRVVPGNEGPATALFQLTRYVRPAARSTVSDRESRGPQYPDDHRGHFPGVKYSTCSRPAGTGADHPPPISVSRNSTDAAT